MCVEKNIFNSFLSNNNEIIISKKFELKHNTLYYKDIKNFEFSKIVDGDILIVYNNIFKKQYFNFLKYCLDSNIQIDKIKLVTELHIDKCNNYTKEYYHERNIINMFDIFVLNYYSFKKINLDLSLLLIYYIKQHNTISIFNDFMKHNLDRYYLGKTPRYNHYTYEDVWIIEDEEIRNSISNIDRKIKIKRLLLNVKE